MTPTKKDISTWLKEIGKDREWLALQCGAKSKRTVEKWFETKSSVPSKAIIIIQGMMKQYPSPITQLLEESDSNEDEQEIVLSFTDDEWSIMERFKKSYPTKSIENYCREKALEFCIGMNDAVKPVSFPTTIPSPLAYTAEVIGNIAAGSPCEGDTLPYAINIPRPLEKEEYILRVNGKSMEPEIMDGALIIVRHHTIPPIPKIGTIVVYTDERGYTLKRLAQRKTLEGKKEYILKPLNPTFPDITPMDGGRIPAIYIETITNHRKA